MPALSSVTFTSTHADSYEPVSLGNGIWNLICPDSPETFGPDVTTLIDLHLDITIPAGFYGVITHPSTGIVGTSNCGVIPQVLLPGTTSVSLNVANPSALGETPTANNVIAKLVLIKGKEFKYTQAGTWA